MKTKHPIQPLVLDKEGVIRFKENKVVRYLLNAATLSGVCSMNALAILPFDDDDRTQFAQLIGYSVSGAGDLDYFSRSVLARADREAATLFGRGRRKSRAARSERSGSGRSR